MPNFPAFIFADENHLSPLNSNILAKLAPRLKLLGYNDFYYESPKGKSSDQMTTVFNKEIIDLEEIRSAFYRIQIEIIDYIEIHGLKANSWFITNEYLLFRIHLLEQLEKRENTPDYMALFYVLSAMELMSQRIGEQNMSCVVLKNIILKLGEFYSEMAPQKQLAIIHLLETLALEHINFQGIDDDTLMVGADLNSTATLEKNLTQLTELANFNKRDKIMASAYLQASTPVFGLVGLAHVMGMQEFFAKMISKDIAKANFNFIYVHSMPPESSMSLSLEPEIQKFIANMRGSLDSAPLGVTLVDATNKSEDDIVEEIMVKIQEKIAEYKLLPDALKKIPDISYTDQLYTKLTNLYGFFGDIKNSVSTVMNEALPSSKKFF